jgi:hypothetical protein
VFYGEDNGVFHGVNASIRAVPANAGLRISVDAVANPR